MLDFLVWFQQFRNPVLDFLAEAITISAEENVILVAICIIYWCINKKAGYVIGLAVVLSSAVNSALKDIFKVIRPWNLDDRIIPIRKETATGYSFPSGHTQTGASFWTALALTVKKKWFIIISIIMMLLIAYSRVYLSVHTPLDVIAGLLLAVLIACLSYYMIHVMKISTARFVFVITSVILIIMLLFIKTETFYKMAGVTLSFLPSYMIEYTWIRFNVKSKLWKQAAKTLIGFVIAFGIRFGLSAIFPEVLIFDFIRYFLMGIGILILAPWIFIKTKLSTKLSVN